MANELSQNRKALNTGIRVGSRTSIIQCPSCQTKFALRTAQLEEVRNPRFHCSRCDHIFSMDEILISSHPSPVKRNAEENSPGSFDSEEALKSSWTQTNSEFNQSNSENKALVNQEDEALVDEDEDSIAQSYDSEDLEDEFTEGSENSETYHFEDDLEGQAIEEDDRQYEPWRFDAPKPEKDKPRNFAGSSKEEQIRFPFESADTEVPFLDEAEDDEEDELGPSPISWMDKVLPIKEKPSAPSGKKPPIPELEDNWLSDIGKSLESPEENEGELRSTKILRKSNPPSDKSQKVATPTPPPTHHSSMTNETLAKPSEHRSLFREIASTSRTTKQPVQTTFNDVPLEESTAQKWRSVYILGSILILALIGLTILSYRLLNNPTSARSVFSSALSIGPTSPPPGVFISDVQFKELSLENNIKLPTISGKVLNKSDRNFKEVVIIGGLFDRKGASLFQEKTNLSSPLHKSRIKSLSVEMIQRLQTEGSDRGFVLKAGGEAPFLLPFTSNLNDTKTLQKAAHFAAKVFSVSE